MEKTTSRLGAAASAGYASGSLVTGAFSTVPGLLMLPYLTDTLGVAAGLAGALAFVPKAWTVLVNPIAGRISDRTTTSIGSRRPYVLGAGTAVGIGFALMFAGPFAAAAGAAWAITGYLLTATTFAFFQSPYAAMPAEMTDDYGEHTRLMSWRVAGIALATLATGGVAPLVVKSAGGGLPGHQAMGVLVGAVIVIGAVAAFCGTARAARPAAPAAASLRSQLAVASRSRSFRRLLVIVTLQSAATGAQLAGASYLARQLLGDPAAAGLLVAAFTAPALVLLPVLLRVGGGLDKRTGVLVSSTAYLLVSVLWLAVPGGSPLFVLVLGALLGAANAAQDTFVLAMLPDCIAEESARSGHRQAGVFAGVFSAGQGLGFAVGPLLFGLVLQIAGYIPSTTGEAVAQSDTTATGVLLGFGVLPAALTALSLLALGLPFSPGRRTPDSLRR
ncbi:MFS transporter [Pseudonocardia sp. DSM 110487]|uniref:MFS transporter n=1 Tax=Pseudonocardia sp. DSM 110487 TaxID=2865833 RepID=UPI001C6A4471|nr:MFS transporter [Pseudonocardia sp. DSM 110487]QYN36997.1 MFS transporter [Pseudonocardia sp. DSM 110487]